MSIPLTIIILICTIYPEIHNPPQTLTGWRMRIIGYGDTKMSTLQFVILLAVIFLSTNGPAHVHGYVQTFNEWLLERRVLKIRTELRKYGILFRCNRVGGTMAFCLDLNWITGGKKSSDGFIHIDPLFIFSDKLASTRCSGSISEGYELLGDFVWVLLDRKYPRKIFDRKLLKRLEGVTVKTEVNLFVPPLKTDSLSINNIWVTYLSPLVGWAK